MSTSPKITERRQTMTQTNIFLYICVCVNKAIKKKDFTFCGPAKGPDSESHDGWWQNLQTKHQQLQSVKHWTSTNRKIHPATQKLQFWTGQAAVKKSPHKAKSQLKAFQASTHLKKRLHLFWGYCIGLVHTLFKSNSSAAWFDLKEMLMPVCR